MDKITNALQQANKARLQNFLQNISGMEVSQRENVVPSQHQIEKGMKTEKLQGGMADHYGLDDIAKKHGVDMKTLVKQYEMGMTVEKEHSSDEDEIKEIVKDHLMEDPSYYTKLSQMESDSLSKAMDRVEALCNDNELSSSEQSLLEKGGKRAVIGEKRMFGGREYIKTPDGWKFHGKGTGKKATAHREAHQAKTVERMEKERGESKIDHEKEAQKWANELHSPTELSRNMTMTEIDEKHAHHSRQAQLQAGTHPSQRNESTKKQGKSGDQKHPLVGKHVSVLNHKDLPTSLMRLGGQKLEVVGTEKGTLSVPQYLKVKDKNGEIHSINPNYVSQTSSPENKKSTNKQDGPEIPDVVGKVTGTTKEQRGEGYLKNTNSLEKKTARELRSYLMGNQFPNDAKIRIQEKIGYADTTVKELRDRLYDLQDQDIPVGIKSIELESNKQGFEKLSQ